MLSDEFRGETGPGGEVIVIDCLEEGGFDGCKTSCMKKSNEVMFILIIPQDHIDVRGCVIISENWVAISARIGGFHEVTELLGKGMSHRPSLGFLVPCRMTLSFLTANK